MADFIRLPSQRIAQLHQLAKANDQTVVELISDFINAQIAAGVIPADIPGVTIEREDDTITLSIGDKSRAMDATQIGVLSQQLHAAVGFGKIPTPEDLIAPAKKMMNEMQADTEAFVKRQLPALDPISWLKVGRRGTSVRIHDDVGFEQVFAPTVAKDLADQLEAKIK